MTKRPLWIRVLDRVFPFVLAYCAGSSKVGFIRILFLLLLVLWAFYAEIKKEDEE